MQPQRSFAGCSVPGTGRYAGKDVLFETQRARAGGYGAAVHDDCCSNRVTAGGVALPIHGWAPTVQSDFGHPRRHLTALPSFPSMVTRWHAALSMHHCEGSCAREPAGGTGVRVHACTAELHSGAK